MPAKEAATSAKQSERIPNTADLTDMARQQINAMADVQKDLLKSLEQSNQLWQARIQAETDLANESVRKLSATRSLPETTAVMQEWLMRRMALFAEDGQRFSADMEKSS